MRVVALGGGHGLAVTLTALRLLGEEPTAIVAVADDGGFLGAAPPRPGPAPARRPAQGHARPGRPDRRGPRAVRLPVRARRPGRPQPGQPGPGRPHRPQGGFQEALEEASRGCGSTAGPAGHAGAGAAVRPGRRPRGRGAGGDRHGQRPGRVGLAGAGPTGGGAGRGPRRPPGRPGPARPRLDLHLGGAQPARPRAGRRPDRGLAAGLHLQPGGPAGETTGFPPRATWPRSSTTAPACGGGLLSGPGTPPAPPGSCGPSPSSGRRSSTPRWPPTTTPAADAGRLATALKELA